MKRLAAVAALAAAILLTACPPPAPITGGYNPGGAWWEAVVKAINQVFGTAPNNTSIDCAVIIFDQSINPNDFAATWTPVHPPIAQLIPAWLTGCFGAGQGAHTVPTFKATGRPNTPNPNKQAVCWVTSFLPDGDPSQLRFRCTFDRILPQQEWVPWITTNGDGHMKVGSH